MEARLRWLSRERIFRSRTGYVHGRPRSCGRQHVRVRGAFGAGQEREEEQQLMVRRALFQAAAPLPSRIPPSDLIGVTVILLTCSYADQEFVRIGYYVNTEYGDPVLKAQYDASLDETAAASGIVAPDPTKNVDGLVRSVLSEKPRVTRFNIAWFAP